MDNFHRGVFVGAFVFFFITAIDKIFTPWWLSLIIAMVIGVPAIRLAEHTLNKSENDNGDTDNE